MLLRQMMINEKYMQLLLMKAIIETTMLPSTSLYLIKARPKGVRMNEKKKVSLVKHLTQHIVCVAGWLAAWLLSCLIAWLWVCVLMPKHKIKF